MKKHLDKIFSIVAFTPVLVYWIYLFYVNTFVGDISASNAGAIGIVIIFILTFLSLPCLVLSVSALILNKKNENKILFFKVLTLIDIVIWTVLTIVVISVVFM